MYRADEALPTLGIVAYENYDSNYEVWYKSQINSSRKKRGSADKADVADGTLG